MTGPGQFPTVFGIDPRQIVSTADTWDAQSDVVGEIKLDAMSSVTGTMSKVMDELRGTPGSAQPTITSIQNRLSDLAGDLRQFNGVTIASDEDAARKFRGLMER